MDNLFFKDISLNNALLLIDAEPKETREGYLSLFPEEISKEIKTHYLNKDYSFKENISSDWRVKTFVSLDYERLLGDIHE